MQIPFYEASPCKLRIFVGKQTLDAMDWDVAHKTVKVLFNFHHHDLSDAQAREIVKLLKESRTNRVEYVFSPRGVQKSESNRGPKPS